MPQSTKKQKETNVCYFPDYQIGSTPPRSPHHRHYETLKSLLAHTHGARLHASSQGKGLYHPYSHNRIYPIILERYARYLKHRYRIKYRLPCRTKSSGIRANKSNSFSTSIRSMIPGGGALTQWPRRTRKSQKEGKKSKEGSFLNQWNEGSLGMQPTLQDSFGNMVYHRLFRNDPFATKGKVKKNNNSNDDDDNKWIFVDEQEDTSTRMEEMPGSHSKAPFSRFFFFLKKRDFWFLLQFATRLSLIGMLLPSLLVHLVLSNESFFTLTLVLSGVLLSASMSVGQMYSFIVQYIRAACMWLPLSLICVAVKLDHNVVAWFFVYVVLIFLLAFLNKNVTRRMSLLLLNTTMVALLSGDDSILHPFVIFANWSAGVAFSLLTILVPYPILAFKDARRTLHRIFENTATCFAGMLSCFWAENNTERSMLMVRIRYLVRSLDFLIGEFETHNEHSFYEILFFDTYERYEIREEKGKLLWKLKMNLRMMERGINIIQERPQILGNCERSYLFKNKLSKPIQEVTRAIGELLLKISQGKTYADLRNIPDVFENAGKSIKILQDEFELAQKIALYENEEEIFSDSHRMEEFFPLFSFFIFSIVNFWNTLENFQGIVIKHKGICNWNFTLRLVLTSITDTLGDSVTLMRNLFIHRMESECRILIEAAKLSLAMLLSVLFFYNVNNKMLLLSGPTIIAFVSGMNPVETVHASGARLTGTLIGSVIGFFGITLFKGQINRIISICVIVFITSFSRLNMEYASIFGSCTFVAMTLLSSQLEGAEYTISRIQQNAFSIFIYCLISVTILPLSPGEVLYERRLQALKLASQSFKKIMGLLYEASSCHKTIVEKRLKLQEKRGLGNSPPNNFNSSTSNERNEPLSCFPSDNPPLVASVNRSFLPLNRASQVFEASPAWTEDYGDENLNTFIIPVNFAHNSPNENSKPSNLDKYSMPRAFFKDQVDTKIASIFDSIFEMLQLVLSTKSIMEFAANEFSIFPTIYPIRATGDVHIALYRLCVLLYTMACSWERMRGKGYFTEDMIHIFHNLMPLGIDLTECFERFVYVADLYVRNPSPELCSELMKGVTQFRVICSEMSDRAEYNLLEVIRKVISETILARYMNGDSKGNYQGSDATDEDPPVLGFDSAKEPYLTMPQPTCLSGQDNGSVGGLQNATMVFKHLQPVEKGKPAVREHHPLDDHQGDAHGGGLNMAKDDSHPLDTESSSTSFSTHSTCGSSRSNFIQLNNSFVMPTTALDLEGLHTFTLTLIMFGRELQKILFGLEEMLQSS